MHFLAPLYTAAFFLLFLKFAIHSPFCYWKNVYVSHYKALGVIKRPGEQTYKYNCTPNLWVSFMILQYLHHLLINN